MSDKTLGAYVRHEAPDDMDGGVTAALIEKEAEQRALTLNGSGIAAHFRDKRDMERARAERAERERDEAIADASKWQEAALRRAQERDEAVTELQARIELDIATERPLTPDAITDEMVERARRAADAWGHQILLETAAHIIAAALTEPPRPEGAEEIEAYMRELVASHPGDHYAELADHLASRGVLPPLTDKTEPRHGVRVVTEDGAA